MYITDLYLENFQSYDTGHFKFSNKVNLITGASDSGKTVIIRALSWVLFNEYTADLLMRNGCKNVEVKIVFDNGYFIIRGRKNNKNYYIIKTEELNEYTNFGKEIPHEIQEIFLFKKVNIINDKYNILISSQLENSFLLSETDSIKANAIGKLVNIDKLDKATREVSKEIRNKNSEINFNRDIISEKENELKKFDYLEEDKTRLEKLKFIYNNLESNSNYLKNLEILHDKYLEVNNRISNGYKYMERFKPIDEITELKDNLEINIDKVKSYEILQKSYMDISYKINSNKLIVEQLQNIDEVKSISSDLENKFLLIKTLIPISDRYQYVNTNIEKNLITTKNLENLDDIKEKVNNLQKNLPDLNTLINLKNNLDFVVNSIKKCEKILENSHDIEISNLMNNIITNNEKLQKINQINKLLQEYTNSFSNLNNNLDTLNSAVSTEFIITKISKNGQLLKNFLDLKSNLDMTESEEIQYKNTINSRNSEISKLLAEYKNELYNTKICPFCLSEIDEEHVDKIIEELKR